MHWTALLARHAFLANARVVEDLACAGCGYNLRGLAATGRCPECGHPVAESLYLVREPGPVGAALQTIAYSYGMIALAIVVGLPALLLTSRGLAWVALGLAALGSFVRLLALVDLRRRAGLERLPLIGGRQHYALVLAAVEALLATAALGGTFVLMGQPPAGRYLVNAAGFATLAWPVAMVVGMLQTSRFGGLLADLLDYEFVNRELRVHRLLTAIGAALIVVTVLAARSAVPPSVVLAIVGPLLGLVVVGVGLGFLIVGVLHVAGAAQRATVQRDDVLAQDPPGVAPASPAAPPTGTLPDIELAPKSD